MREKVLMFGSNFAVSTRIADLVRREYEVIEFRFDSAQGSVRKTISTVFTGELLFNALVSSGARHVVFTSESLLHMDSSVVFAALLEELRNCKRMAGVNLACVCIEEPIITGPGRSIKTLEGDSPYRERLARLSEVLASIADLVLQVSSVYSPDDDVWSQNFIHLLFDASRIEPIEICESIDPWQVVSADGVAQALLSRLNQAGTVKVIGESYTGGLRAFCLAATTEFSLWSSSRFSTTARIAQREAASSRSKGAEIRRELHSVIRQSRCAVSYLYRKRPDAVFGSDSIASLRDQLGTALTRSIPSEVVDSVDMVVPVPETGRLYARGLARSLNLPYIEAIYKSDKKRSFDIKSFDVRRNFLYSRLGVVQGVLTGKNVIIVDEAIFTGATLKVVSRLLRDEGVKKLYFAIPSPEARYRCSFNMQPERALLSDYVRREDLPSYFDAQGVFFQDEDVFMQLIEKNEQQCTACFIQRGACD
jgi:adenine/guanine phosphoribosyltransferase-like PRPP-binding protein